MGLRTRRRLTAAVLLWAGASVAARAAEPGLNDIFEFYKDEVVSVASKTPQKAREAPGIVTVITREEILNSGARDLIDVLQLVPGFSFGLDTQGVVSAGFRGIWGQEGKILLMIDGQPMNEIDYGTLQFGNHYPIQLVQRIEIIRGPGSVVYGGFAELAVINIVTQSAEDLRGGAASWTYGRMQHGLGLNNGSLALGGVSKSVPGLSGTISGVYGQGNRSDATYYDQAGGQFSMPGNNTLDPRFLNSDVRYKDLHLHFLYDAYHTGIADGFGPVIPQVEQTFPSYYFQADYAWKPAEDLTLTPQLNYEWQQPWLVADENSPMFGWMTFERYTAALNASYDGWSSLSLLGGVSGYEEYDYLNSPDLVGLQRPLDVNGADSARFKNYAAFAQGAYLGELADVTVGLREEYHSKYGSSFVPRLAVTKVSGPWHGKLLYSQAFRAPVIANIAVNPGIRPERTTTLEAEGGYVFGQGAALTLNIFDTTIMNPIVYGSQVINGQPVESYFNFTRTGTRGVELTGKLTRPWGYASLGYSLSSAAGKNEVSQYQVPGRQDLLVGLPAQKLTLNASAKVAGGLKINPSAILLGERYGYLTQDSSGNPQIGRVPPTLLLNLFLTYDVAAVKGLGLGAGVYNLLDKGNPFVQAYNGGHPPLPGPSREYIARVTYAFGGR